MVGDDQRQLDAAGLGALADAHPARSHAHHRVLQPPCPAIGDGRRRRQHDRALQIAAFAATVAGGARPAPPRAPDKCRRRLMRAVQINRRRRSRIAATSRSGAGIFPTRRRRSHACAPGNSATDSSRRLISAPRVRMPEYRQAEGRLGHEQIAHHRLEGGGRSDQAGACNRPRRRRAPPDGPAPPGPRRAHARPGTNVTRTPPMVRGS